MLAFSTRYFTEVSHARVAGIKEQIVLGFDLCLSACVSQPRPLIDLARLEYCVSLDRMLQAGVQHLVFSGLIDPRPFKPTLPVDPTSGCQIPHYETKAQIKVTPCCRLLASCSTLFQRFCVHVPQQWYCIALQGTVLA